MKKETLGIILGSVSFLPVFLTVWLIGFFNFGLSIILLLTTQALWLTSITLCTKGLENKSKYLREQLKNEKEISQMLRVFYNQSTSIKEQQKEKPQFGISDASQVTFYDRNTGEKLLDTDCKCKYEGDTKTFNIEILKDN